MAEVQWERYPSLAGVEMARRWLQIQADLGLARNTVEAYGRGLEEYFRFVQALRLDYETVRHEQIAAYVRHLLSRPRRGGDNVVSLESGGSLANATLQQRITVVRLFYDFLVEEQRCVTNPVGRGRYTPSRGFGGARNRGLIPRFRKLPWIPDDRDWNALLKVASQRSLRTRLMLALGYEAALRREELCSLETGDIDPSQRLVRVHAERTKNRLERIVPYSERTGVLFQQYLGQRHRMSSRRGGLFLSESQRNYAQPVSIWAWSKIVKQLACDSGITSFTTHSLRHLRLTDLARAGWDLQNIATFAGHRCLQTSLRYIHLSGRELAAKLQTSMAEINTRRLELLGKVDQ